MPTRQVLSNNLTMKNFCGLACSAVRSGSTYTMNYKIYLMDYYDWEKGSTLRGGLVSDGDMYELHIAGMAKEFKSIGTYTKDISWKKGETINETVLW